MVAKKPLVELELSVSVVVPVLVVALPYWSSSWRPSVMLVVADVVAVVGVGVMRTLVAAPAALVSEKVTVLVPVAEAVMVSAPAVVLAVKADEVATPLALVVATHE